VLVKNVSEFSVAESFVDYGLIEISAGEIKDVPEEVALLWLESDRWPGGVSRIALPPAVAPVVASTTLVENQEVVLRARKKSGE